MTRLGFEILTCQNNRMMKKEQNNQNSTNTQMGYDTVLPAVYPCKKIRAGKYEYRGWIISSVGYYHPEHCVCWEGYDPKTGHADFHGFSKKEIKWLIDYSLSKNGR